MQRIIFLVQEDQLTEIDFADLEPNDEFKIKDADEEGNIAEEFFVDENGNDSWTALGYPFVNEEGLLMIETTY